jgi:hypothetical protein
LELSPTFPQVGVPVVDCVTPLPLREIVAGELLALLATETLPLALPEAVGAKVTLSVAVCPGVSVVFALTPLALYPVPLVLTPEIVTFEFPVFVRATLKTLLLPTFTFAKSRLVGLVPSTAVTVFTVSVAALLVAVPAEFVTTTRNVEPVSEVVVAGVV